MPKRNKPRPAPDSAKASAHLREAVKAGRVEFAPCEAIRNHEATIDRIVAGLLGVPGGYMVTDWSRLSDFAPAGLPHALACQCDGHTAQCSAWREWIGPALRLRFGVEIEPDALLIDVARAVEAGR